MTRVGSVLVGLAVLVLLSCSSSDDATPSPTPVATPTTEPPAESTAPTTSAAPTTTNAPTTTIDPAAALAAEVEADFLETFRLTDIAIQDPTNEEKVAAALDGYIGSNRDLIESQIADLRANGYVARPNPDVDAGVIIEQPAVLASSPDDTALIQVCEIDSWLVVEPGAGPEGSDAIVDPDITAYRSNYVLAIIDGQWRIRGGETIGEWTGATSCPSE